MALEMRAKCEKCEKGLQINTVAYICLHECTFCHKCTESMEFVCPNCGGELVKRPRGNEDQTSCPVNA